jgi:hypothetical protein
VGGCPRGRDPVRGRAPSGRVDDPKPVAAMGSFFTATYIAFEYFDIVSKR